MGPNAGEQADGDVSLDWLELPMGRFVMGSDAVEAPEDERPSRSVSVGSLAISRLPVTVKHWTRFVEATSYRTIAEVEGSSFRRCIDPGDPVGALDWWAAGQGDAQAPVVHVAWLDVWEFCRWAGVRLPTEAEWAWAAANEPQLVGELWQWCDDWYSADFFRDEQRVNPTGPTSGTHRVARGGSARPTERAAVMADLSAADLGFRVIRRR